MRNKKIFEDQNPNLDLCCSRSLSMFTAYAKIKKSQNQSSFSLSISAQGIHPWDFLWLIYGRKMWKWYGSKNELQSLLQSLDG